MVYGIARWPINIVDREIFTHFYYRLYAFQQQNGQQPQQQLGKKFSTQTLTHTHESRRARCNYGGGGDNDSPLALFIWCVLCKRSKHRITRRRKTKTKKIRNDGEGEREREKVDHTAPRQNVITVAYMHGKTPFLILIEMMAGKMPRAKQNRMNIHVRDDPTHN